MQLPGLDSRPRPDRVRHEPGRPACCARHSGVACAPGGGARCPGCFRPGRAAWIIPSWRTGSRRWSSSDSGSSCAPTGSTGSSRSPARIAAAAGGRWSGSKGSPSRSSPRAPSGRSWPTWVSVTRSRAHSSTMHSRSPSASRTMQTGWGHCCDGRSSPRRASTSTSSDGVHASLLEATATPPEAEQLFEE